MQYTTMGVERSVAVHCYGCEMQYCSTLLLVWSAVLQYTAMGVDCNVAVHYYECRVKCFSTLL